MNVKHFYEKLAPGYHPGGRVHVLRSVSAAAVVIVIAAAVVVAAAEDQDQNDDPPPVVPANAAQTVGIAIHKIGPPHGFPGPSPRSFHDMCNAGFGDDPLSVSCKRNNGHLIANHVQ